MKNLKLILTTALFTTLFSCVNSDDYGIPDQECSDLVANVTVQSVTSSATSAAVEYMTDDIIEAYVTSSDQGGNFYKTISFSSLDGTVGFSIPVDNYNLYTKYEPGRKVFINMKNRFYNIQNNSTVIGSSFNNGVGRISGVEYQSIITRSCTKVDENDIVKHLTIAQAKSDANLNMLVEFDAVQFTNPSLGKKYYDASLNSIGGATNHEITDEFGNKITVRISEYSGFKAVSVPSGNGKIRGVITKFGSIYQFMIRTLNDVKLTNDRVDNTVSGNPTAPTNLLFLGADFENWTTFNNSVNAFGLKPYAVQGIGLGTLNTNSLHLNGTPTANDYVFTISASAHGTIPANPTKITFWVKGTSAKSLSLNVYRQAPATGYDVFNVDNLTTSAVILSKAVLNSSNNGTNSYIGTINTSGEWVKVTLNISDVLINTSTTGDLFALKVGSNSLYNLQIDNIEIQ